VNRAFDDTQHAHFSFTLQPQSFAAYSAVRTEDATAPPSQNFLGRIWADLGKIWANFIQICSNFTQ